MTVGERIKQRRKERGLSADELAEKLNKNRATVYRYESSDIERIPAEVLKPLSEILQVSPEYLMGWSEEEEKNGLDRLVRDIEKDKKIKIEDVLQCSDTIPILNYTENGKMIFNEHLCLSDLHGDFCFKAADNSMSNSQIYAGAIVFIKKTDTIKNKDIVMISLNGKIFIRKYYYYTENQKLILYADNPDFEPMIFIGDEINNIKIIGDLPIYVSYDSADVWAHPEEFQLDENLCPIEVAGCPPDGFSADGQLWGNPLFNWDYMKETGYQWWVNRIAYQSKIYDVIRIDHFRGFDEYYAIPYGDSTAKNGYWKPGPGMDLFTTIENKLGKLPIIAEDLGFLTDSVKQLLASTGFPGMKVLEFAFDSRDTGSGYLPHCYPNNCVVYTGTHDNDTILGWFETAPEEFQNNAIRYLRLTKEEGYHIGMMRCAWASVANTAIMQMQDFLGLGVEGRMNTPSTLGGNMAMPAGRL